MSDFAAPVDATTTPAWAALKAHHDELVSSGFSLKEAFAADAGRVERLSFDMDDLRFDLSKNLVPLSFGVVFFFAGFFSLS